MCPQWPSSSPDTEAKGRLNANCFSSRQLVLIQDSVIFAVLVWVPCHDSSVIPKKVSARWLLGARNKTLTINYSESHLPGPQPSVAPPALCLMSRSGAFSTEPTREGVRSVPVSPDPPAARLTKISASSWSCGMPSSGSKSGWGCFVADGSRYIFSVWCAMSRAVKRSHGSTTTRLRGITLFSQLKKK